MKNVMYVIGDKYQSFSLDPHVITASQFVQDIKLDSAIKINTYVGLMGQGLTMAQMCKLAASSVILEKRHKKEDCKYVHKVNTENVMISQPISSRKEEKIFISELMIDENCDMMSDHVTGCHIQGMVLIEAARQMALSVSEHYLLPESLRLNNYFTLNNFSIKFNHFMFPMDVEMECHVTRYELIKDKRLNTEMQIIFYQNDLQGAIVTIEVSAFEKNQLQRTEQALAKLCIDKAKQKICMPKFKSE